MPDYAPFLHNIDGADHARAFRVTDAGTNNVSVAAGRVRIDQAVTNFATATALGPLANGTHFVYISSLAVITALLGGPYPAGSWPLARVVVAAGDITGITDDRAIAASVDTGGGGAGTIDIEEDGVPEGAADTLDFIEPDANLVAFAAGQATISTNIYALLAGRAGGQILTGGTGASEKMQLRGTSHATEGWTRVIDRLQVRDPTDVQVLAHARITGDGRGWVGGGFVVGGAADIVPPPNEMQGIGGFVVPSVATAPTNVYGLSFAVINQGAGGVTTRGDGCFVGMASVFAIRAFTDVAHYHAEAPTWLVSGVVTRYHGVEIEDMGSGNFTTVYGLSIDHISAGSNRYLIWAGAAPAGTPRLRLDAGTPAANQTMLHLAEGVVPTLRRVQWMDPGAGGVNFVGGERVMVLV